MNVEERDPQTYAIIGTAMEIHRQLGHGFLEIVEFKALSKLSSVEEAQLLNYLKATGMQRGLLINFGASSLQCKRLVWGYEEPIKKSAFSV